MAKSSQEDLFEKTSMTFGEHLEELRSSLFRSLAGLMLGMLVGFLIARPVVNWVKTPLMKGLNEHYALAAKTKLEEEYGDQLTTEMSHLAEDNAFIYEEVYLEWNELQWLSEQVAQHSQDSERPTGSALLEARTRKLPSPTPPLLKTRIWRKADAKMTILSAQEAFMIWLKAAAVSGLILACPYIFYQIWAFVAAGLYPHEKRYVHIFLPFSVVLFLAGAALAFFFVFGPVLDFLFGFARRMGFDPDLRISEVISFVLILPLGFGIAFQLPLVMLFINRIGIVSIKAYLEKWRIAILVIFVISMLLTPADPVSMILMAVPLTALYFLGIGLCKWMPKGRNPFSEPYEPD